MQRYRLFLITALSIGFAVACLLWIFYFPFRPAQVLRVVPPEAVAASWHRQPEGRIGALLKTAPAALVLAAADLTTGDAQQMLDSPGIQELIRHLGGTGATLAYAPSFGGLRKPALILGAWVGGVTTHWMRAGLMDKAFDGYKVHRLGRYRLWIGFFPDLPFGMRYVSFGVYEGVLAGCASSDPFAAVSLLAALRRHGPLPALVSPWVDRRGGLKSEFRMAPDIFRGHVATGTGEAAVYAGEFQLLEDGALTGKVVLEQDGGIAALPALSVLSGAADENDILPETLLPLPGDIPAVLAATTVGRGVAAAAGLPALWRERLLLEPLAGLASPGAAVMAWISGGAYSGRIMRMRVPGIGMAMQVPPATGVETVAARAADMINSAYGIGLIAVPDRQDRRIYSFQPVRDSGFLRTEEYPAIAITDGWLIATTNIEALRRLLDRVAGLPPKPVGDGIPAFPWLYASARLPDAGETASSALAGYALLRLMQTGKAERLDTPPVRRVLAAMAEMGAFSLRAGQDADGRLTVAWAVDHPGGGSHE